MEKIHTIRPAARSDVFPMAQIIIAGHRQVLGNSLPPSKEHGHGVQSEDSPAQAAHQALDDLYEWVIRANAAPEHVRAQVAVRLTNSRVVGLMLAHRLPSNRVELSHLFVAPPEQNRGIGTDLLADFTGWAGPDVPHTLAVASTNQGAIRLYEREGFGLVPDTEQEVPPLVFVTMQREPQGESV